MSFLDNLRKQPERNRKLILWTVVIISAIGLVILWGLNSCREIKNFSKEKFIHGLNLPPLEEKINKNVSPLLKEKLKKETDKQQENNLESSSGEEIINNNASTSKK